MGYDGYFPISARRSSVDEVAAIAGYNLGVVLGALDRSADAVAVYDDVVARFGDATEPFLCKAVAIARTALAQRRPD